ncbi:PLD nuclease N-terminal domain-containing protein [Streptomyces sp. NBC_00481]|uniref:PLD nuclease N-terminal domain-containing protein n=1 Tax=Streptomyces sp. NBC_00481 TaxID=2975755 RepID=UPI002DD7E04F|nr:PLD nuclease N-terminal domain-containing protein [Streptomyces sp. NBC_00481]WRY96464.1 PLD nuclease N-terminal domain-containing protein [Streptomyces sp. NBC_00481]
MLRVLMYLVPLALTIYAFIDCLNTPEDEAKHLPKIAWVFIILLFWIVGPIAWLAAGKLRNTPAGGRTPSEWHHEHRTQYVAPDDNPEFLKSLAEDNKNDESLLKSWEADLRRREEELKRQEEEKPDQGGKGSKGSKGDKKDGEE